MAVAGILATRAVGRAASAKIRAHEEVHTDFEQELHDNIFEIVKEHEAEGSSEKSLKAAIRVCVECHDLRCQKRLTEYSTWVAQNSGLRKFFLFGDMSYAKFKEYLR